MRDLPPLPPPERRIIKRAFLSRNLVACAMALVLALSVCEWLYASRPLPSEIVIATAEPGGLYHKFGLLESREADLAILQLGPPPLAGLALLAPLYEDVTRVIVRVRKDFRTIAQFAGKNISLGGTGSVMRQSAIQVLGHFGVDPASIGRSEAYFGELLTDPELDGDIVTTGLTNPDLEAVMSTRDFILLPISNGDAISAGFPGPGYAD